MTPDTVDSDLRAIDDALASGRVSAPDSVERELQELALSLRADTPAPDDQYAERLAQRVHDGFPRPARGMGRAFRFPRWLTRPRTLSLAGGTVTLLVLVGVALSLQDGGEEDGREILASGRATEEAPSALGSPPSAAGDDFEPGRGRRAIERSAELTLAAAGEELDRVADEVIAVTDRHRGFVLRSSVTSGDDGSTGGTFELRIPAERLRPALRQLAELGHVRSRTQSGQDVTREVAGVADRLRTARAERRSLLRRLERAGTDAEAESIRRRLDLVAREIRGLRSQARNLRLRTDYASVSVELVQEKENGSEGAGLGSTGDALDDAVGSLAGALNLALRVLGVLLPFALLGGLSWLVARSIRKRRREAALS
jgi:hypothetical protein